MNEKTQKKAATSDRLRSLYALGIVLAIACVTIVILILTSGQSDTVYVVGEKTLETMPGTSSELNMDQIIDAVNNAEAVAREGYRYRVLIDDLSDDGSSGIAHIGGLVTFIDGVSKGDIAVVRITRLGRSVANAECEKIVETSTLQQEKIHTKAAKKQPIVAKVADTEPPKPIHINDIQADDMKVGAVYEGTVTEMGSKGDGIIKVDGKVVFVKGSQLNETCQFKITDIMRAFNIAEKTKSISAQSETAETGGTVETEKTAHKNEKDKEVTVGDIYDVTIEDKDRNNPDTDGIARINGLIVFVRGTQPGDQVKIKITDKAPRFARAAVIE
jgi:predicted RNA-binding protein with TRAM domain